MRCSLVPPQPASVPTQPPAQVEGDTKNAHEWGVQHQRAFQRLWQLDFQVLEELPLSPRPLNLSRQAVIGPGYYSEGSLRASEDHCYFCYSISGVGTFWDTHGAHPLPPGWGFLVEINDPQTGYCGEMDPQVPWEFLAFTFTGLAAHAMTRDLVGRYGGVYALPAQSPIVQRLLSCATGGYAVARLHAVDGAEIVIELLLALAAAARSQEEPSAVQDLVQRALHLIEESGEAPLSVTELAQRLEISRERLSRAFRLHLNLSPHRLIREQRIRRACFLLKDTDMPIKQIAAHLGYTDYTNFIRAFRQVMQMTPREFYLHGSITFLPSTSLSLRVEAAPEDE